MKLRLVFLKDEATKQLVGHFEDAPHVVAYANNVNDLSKELFKSLSILADYNLRQQEPIVSKWHEAGRVIEIEI